MDLSELLTFAVDQKASDLHLSSGLPPMVRVDGDLRRLNLPELDLATSMALLQSMMTEQHRKLFEAEGEVDFSFHIQSLARFRANVFKQERGVAGVFRVVPHQVCSLAQLGIPDVVAHIMDHHHGLVLVTGPTGSGKSTTLAAVVDHINQNHYRHILTIEDPIEFAHSSAKSLVHQREVHRDTQDFHAALRAALREDPDVILVGELRDLDTIRLALTAAETGHLVLATLHTMSATKTINRIVDVFPGREKAMVRSALSESLQSVLSQRLVQKIDGGRQLVMELMVCTPAIRNLIREDKVAQMYSMIQTGQAQGMQTLDQHLKQLMMERVITQTMAQTMAEHRLDL